MNTKHIALNPFSLMMAPEDVLQYAARQEQMRRRMQSPPVRRRKTALFTAIVGSTPRLIQMGDRAWSKVLDKHDAVATSVVEKFRGRIVRNTGDGLLVVFNSELSAFACALALVQALEAIGLPIRAGLAVGNVVIRGVDVTGVTINIAARVMEKAGAGEILVARTLKEVKGGGAFTFTSKGFHNLVDFDEQFEIFDLAPAKRTALGCFE